RAGVNVIVLQRDKLAIGSGAKAHALLRAGAMADGLKHHLATDDELDGLAKLSCRGGCQRTVGPRKQFAAKAGTDEFCDDTNIFLRQSEHLGKHALQVEDALRRFVERKLRAFPNRGGGMQLEGIVRFGGRDVGLIELDLRGFESGLDVAALALQAI